MLKAVQMFELVLLVLSKFLKIQLSSCWDASMMKCLLLNVLERTERREKQVNSMSHSCARQADVHKWMYFSLSVNSNRTICNQFNQCEKFHWPIKQALMFESSI